MAKSINTTNIINKGGKNMKMICKFPMGLWFDKMVYETWYKEDNGNVIVRVTEPMFRETRYESMNEALELLKRPNKYNAFHCIDWCD